MGREMNEKITIQVFCEINPSEDLEKIKTSIFNLFPDLKIKIQENRLSGSSNDIELLSKVIKSIKNRQTVSVLSRIMKTNMAENSTWFYLNKQAAFVDVIALCNDADESALGPIKIVLNSNNIEEIIENMAFG
jgi:predicted RNA binding protein with dsRBD fold (UPF0201 family)|tara:strand:- start:3696 stop:4094 length:399 start_codon:yes stop_codon:yes gene_type:complete